MPQETICKTVSQYNKEPLSREDMEKLREIAEDYRKVKNYVYQRYGGVGSLGKLYPGYTIQNEMTGSGLRESLGMPAVYFYLAVFEALGDIKTQWARTKSQVLLRIQKNESLTEEEKHFLRYILKVGKALEAALEGKDCSLPEELQRKYDLLAATVDIKRLEHYLRRQVRRYHTGSKLHADRADGFAITERAYRYGKHGIYISVKEKRKRIFVPLTDGNAYQRQLYVKLFPKEGKIELRVPVDVTVKKHEDYQKHVGVAMGMRTMLVTDQGSWYGEAFGSFQTALSDWMWKQTGIYNNNRKDNPGRKKYYAKKRRMEEQLHGYVNQELNRFLREEKPCVVYLPKLPPTRKTGGKVKKINHSVSMWQRGYIRERLLQKCREHSVQVAEVLGKGISSQCSQCGCPGEKKQDWFYCPFCGYQVEKQQNTAQNALRRGIEMDHKEKSSDE